jgi:ankyrin repeat protein
MVTSGKTPYALLGVPEDIDYVKLRTFYRQIIHDHKQNKISADDFRCKVRAYETLSDFDKRNRYNSCKEWISNLPLVKYTAQQLAAEPGLILILQDRLRNANLTDINAQDPVTGHTVLYCAARAGNVAAVQFLTEQGAEPDLSQRTGSTALHVAAFYGHGDVVRCLLESGADYRIQNAGKNTAEKESYNDEVRHAFIELKEMPYVRAAANEIDWFSNNILEEHIDKEYYAQRQTLLHCASKKDHFDLVRLLVEQLSANLDIVDINANSALHLAAYGGHTEIVDYLLNSGCDSTLINKWGLTAEQEGSKHGNSISDIFQDVRNRDMFEMARSGVDWWFQYYFGTTSPDATDSNGISLLYHACRHDQYTIAKWLLEHGANVNIKMEKAPKSTSLHGAKYHGHLKLVELLLEYGADVTIKNDFKATVFEEGLSEEVHQDIASKINELLLQYRINLKNHEIIDVFIYLDKDEGDNPKTKIQLHPAAIQDDLLQALPSGLQKECNHFSIARRPLYFDKKDTTIISAVCRARYANSKFIETPLRLTLHQEPPKVNNTHRSIHQEPKFDFRNFNKQFQTQSKVTCFPMKPSTGKQNINVGDLTFTFSESSIKDDIKFEVRTLFSADPETFGIPGCICLFEAALYEDTPKLIELPVLSIASDPYACLYTLATPSAYWFRSDTRRTRLPMIDGIHAFVQHVSVIPILLMLPADMVIAAALGQPLISQEEPMKCTCLVLQEHDPIKFPERAYHGTNIAVVRSILADGLVIPGTVVGAGKRINPPKNHIARGRKAFKVDDFADAIFLSPSVHYSSDPAYAIAFPYDDRQLLPVLECSVKTNGYQVYPCTVPGYTAHPSDNLEAIEWRVSDPGNVIINAVLFIPTVDSLEATARERIAKLTLGFR